MILPPENTGCTRTVLYLLLLTEPGTVTSVAAAALEDGVAPDEVVGAGLNRHTAINPASESISTTIVFFMVFLSGRAESFGVYLRSGDAESPQAPVDPLSQRELDLKTYDMLPKMVATLDYAGRDNDSGGISRSINPSSGGFTTSSAELMASSEAVIFSRFGDGS